MAEDEARGPRGGGREQSAEMASMRVARGRQAATAAAPASVRGAQVVAMAEKEPKRRTGGKSKSKHKGRRASMDADVDRSDDQMDIARGRGLVDSVFQGAGMQDGTHNAIMVGSDYQSDGLKNLSNIEDGYYISPEFLDKFCIHVAKNFLKLRITPIVMSAGELESGNAGEPAKLIRTRYREASDIISKGKMSSLFINDLDAGAGRMGGSTQYTVNNQMVNATLMNIADNPTNVQLPGVYNTDEIPRVPVMCTGNDFSTLYAPLIRDGRMEKFYWNPTREDRIGICGGIFREDDVGQACIEKLVDSFPGQSIDFFGALRSRVYDDLVRDFVSNTGVENLGSRLVNSREGPVRFANPNMTLPNLMKYGELIVSEQDNVKRVQLADEYLEGAALAGEAGSSMPEAFAES